MCSYKYVITEDWESGSVGYRARRITDMIVNHTGLHDMESMVRCCGEVFAVWIVSSPRG